MNIWTEDAKAFMYKYLNSNAPVSNEVSGQKIWLDYITPFVDEWNQDNYGTVYGTINPGQKFSVVIEAHADEISWYVNHISDDGFIGVIRNGGSDHLIAPSKKVQIHGSKGDIIGVFGWPAIHVRRGKDSNLTPKIENIFIDVGAKDKAEVLEMGIHVGNIVTYGDELHKLNDRYYVGRALDNRMGGFAIAQVARLIKEGEIELPYTLHVVNAVQEEVGLRGAQMIAHRLNPDVAIVTDVTHDTNTPMIKPRQEGDLKSGLGPVLTYAPAVHNTVLKHVITAAETNELPFQRSASSRSTGTDTDAFAYSRDGIPSCLISLPLRYMHTTVEMAHEDDIMNLIKLMYHTVVSLSPDIKLSYH
ncbi:MAG: putative aminopeptidase FrvX [Saprospiraceae bacterium]|jgi:putative aminopeptidase FrvX